MEKLVSFFVEGAPEGKGRARSVLNTPDPITGKRRVEFFRGKDAKGNVVKKRCHANILHRTPENTRNYEALIAIRAKAAMRSKLPVSAPVAVILIIKMPIPSSWPVWKRKLTLDGKVRPTVKPDSDNIAKAIYDGSNGIVWVDDMQIVEERKSKIYYPIPGVDVTVYVIDAYTAQISKKPTEKEK